MRPDRQGAAGDCMPAWAEMEQALAMLG